MKFTVTKKADLDEDVVAQVAEEFVEWLGEGHLLNFPDGDQRSYTDLAKEWIRDRNEVVR